MPKSQSPWVQSQLTPTQLSEWIDLRSVEYNSTRKIEAKNWNSKKSRLKSSLVCLLVISISSGGANWGGGGVPYKKIAHCGGYNVFLKPSPSQNAGFVAHKKEGCILYKVSRSEHDEDRICIGSWRVLVHTPLPPPPPRVCSTLLKKSDTWKELPHL